MQSVKFDGLDPDEIQQLPSLIDYKTLAAYAGIKENTIRRWVMEKRIPFIKLAGRKLVRFRAADINEWLDRNSISAGR